MKQPFIKSKLTLLTTALLALTTHAQQPPNAGTITQAVQNVAMPDPTSADNTPIVITDILLQGNTLLADSKLQPILSRLNG